jgi:hypothetical protein
LLQGLPCRGAITVGLLHYHERIVVGPALVKAYQLEQCVAYYPRVILDVTAMEHWKAEFGAGSSHPEHESLVKRDRDGQDFLDIFNPGWMDFLPWTEFVPSPNEVPTDPGDFLSESFKQIETGLAANSGSSRVLAKYEWLATEHKERATAGRR